MKVSCIPVSFFKDILNGKITIGQWAKIGREAGLDGIDLSITFLKNHTPVYLDEVKNQLSKVDIPVVMVTAHPDFTHPSQLQREREFEYLRHDMAISSEIGAKYLRVLAGQAHPEIDISIGIDLAIEYLKKSAHVATRYGIKLLYENHTKPGAWNFHDFSEPTEIFLTIAEGIKDTGIGINFDTANTIAFGDDPIPLLKKVLKRVVTVHASDTSTVGKLNHVLLGTGLTPFKEMFSLLKSGDFNGWICIEENSKLGIEGIRRSVEFVRNIWKEA